MSKVTPSNRTADLGNDPVGRLLIRLALPTITAQIVNLLYNIVDRIYIGRIPLEGKLALTGMGVTFPVITLISHARHLCRRALEPCRRADRAVPAVSA